MKRSKKTAKKAIKKTKKKAAGLKKATVKKNRMAGRDLKYFKKSLLVLKEDLTDQIKHIYDDTLKKSQKDASGDISGYTLHMADVATDTYDREFSLGLATNGQEVLYEIADALKKIEDKSFGFCEQCNKPISKTRLKAIPYTRTCLKCKESSERG
jgi:DnaK suppressor protein